MLSAIDDSQVEIDIGLRVILLGPPGAGKGTQSARLSDALGVSRVSSGDLFRDHQQRGTKMGRLAGSYMERGALVPDDITIKMVMEWVNAGQEESGFLLDGFPRTLAQAEALEEALAPTGGIDKTLHITVPMEELVRRLSGRAICRSCQTPYHSESAPPKEPGRCDRCGGDLYTRDDDQLDAVRKRIQVYLEETEPLVGYYRRRGTLREIDGERSIDEVGRAALSALRPSA